MRLKARVDSNQVEVVKALRKIGAKVQHLHTVGAGCPDLLVGYRRKNYLLEVKVKGGQMGLAQIEWAETWPGEVHTVRTPEEAVSAVIGKEAMR